MRLPFVNVPDFAAQVRSEQKPAFHAGLAEADKAEYERNLIQQRQLTWACQTAATACNWLIIVAAILVGTNGLAIARLAQNWLLHTGP